MISSSSSSILVDEIVLQFTGEIVLATIIINKQMISGTKQI